MMPGWLSLDQSCIVAGYKNTRYILLCKIVRPHDMIDDEA
jgi:hypothetical protein